MKPLIIRLLAGAQLIGLAALWLVMLAPAALLAAGAVLFSVLRGSKAAV